MSCRYPSGGQAPGGGGGAAGAPHIELPRPAVPARLSASFVAEPLRSTLDTNGSVLRAHGCTLWPRAVLSTVAGMRISRFGCTSLLVLVSNACGGAAPPPDSAESANTDAPSSAAPSSEAATEEVQPAGSAAETTASSAPASDDDVSAILQLVVDDPELDAHLHLGEPGRFPLKVAGDKLPSGLKLVKATEPVKVSEPPTSKKDPVLVFTEIEIQGSKATVRYRYDIEGIRATVTLARTPHGWELKNSRLVKH